MDDVSGDVTVRNLNVLHGLFCGEDSCRLEDRIALLSEWLTHGSCADIVTLQEVSTTVEEEVRKAVASIDCGFDYEFVYEKSNNVDDAIILSRYPVESQALTTLYPGFRHVLHARVQHPSGLVDVFTTHLASGSDGAGDPCEGKCPEVCLTAGAQTKRQCQAVELARIVEDSGTELQIVTGDFNAIPPSFEVTQFTDSGFVDTFLAAQQDECSPASGLGCSSGRDSELAELESSESNQRQRIDYILVNSFDTECGPELAGDTDGDGIATGGFAHEPNPFSDECGPAPAPPCWVSDHDGNELDWVCASDDADG
jgi:endonuclease/exonuclease/phosphatase family metal-dependent hydrolase